MDYVADYYVGNVESTDKIFGILKVLAQSENMSYFRSPYIRRIINFQWHNAFKATFYRVFFMNLIIFLLMLLNTSLINRTTRTVCLCRAGLNVFIAIPFFYMSFIYDLPRIR